MKLSAFALAAFASLYLAAPTSANADQPVTTTLPPRPTPGPMSKAPWGMGPFQKGSMGPRAPIGSWSGTPYGPPQSGNPYGPWMPPVDPRTPAQKEAGAPIPATDAMASLRHR
jgi:hypothetical protein